MPIHLAPEALEEAGLSLAPVAVSIVKIHEEAKIMADCMQQHMRVTGGVGEDLRTSTSYIKIYSEKESEKSPILGAESLAGRLGKDPKPKGPRGGQGEADGHSWGQLSFILPLRINLRAAYEDPSDWPRIEGYIQAQFGKFIYTNKANLEEGAIDQRPRD
ncbi:hypothetical protein Tco_0804922 [Tanacetum coccineum]